MAEPLDRGLERGLARVRAALLADDLVRAVGSGTRRGPDGTPRWQRVELRQVDLKAGRHLQVVARDGAQVLTSNHALDGAPGGAAGEAVDALLEEPFGNWHVETAGSTLQLRVTKKGEALVSESARRGAPVEPDRGHDRDKGRLLGADDPVLVALGISDAQGRVKPSRQAKLRQVEEFLRLLDATLADALEAGHLRRPTPEDPLRLVDLGCGNAYLSFAALRFLTHVRGLPVALTGVDVKQQAADHGDAVAAGLGEALGGTARFVVGSIEDAVVEPAPEVVLALHACDTATDEALARAVGWRSPVVLAAPCCHHDVAAQLRAAPTPAPYSLLTRHGILRERLADTLTDGVRAALLRLEGWRVDVVEFVGSQHTPRNTLLRAVRTGAVPGQAQEEYDELVATWGLAPRLAVLLGRTGAAAG